MKLFSLSVFAFAITSCMSTLSGVLLEENGKRIEHTDGRVQIFPLDARTSVNPVILSLDEDGTFSCSDALPSGSYLVESLVPGFKISSQKIHLPTSQTVTFKLKTLKFNHSKSISSDLNRDISRGEGVVKILPPTL